MSAAIVPILLFILLVIGMPVGLTLLFVGSVGLMLIGGFDGYENYRPSTFKMYSGDARLHKMTF